MLGIILAGGHATRLRPATTSISKHLLPVYDKPLIYYPISLLMLANIKEILIITNANDLDHYERLLGDGTQFGIHFEFAIQKEPLGLAQAFIIGESFIGKSSVCLALGDNIFYGQGLSRKLEQAKKLEMGAVVFGYQVNDPERFGVIEFDEDLSVKSIEEKPMNPKSNYAQTGLYFYDNEVVSIAKTIKPSIRNELEITSINQVYLSNNNLKVELLGRGYSWIDAGTHDSLLEASVFVRSIEQLQGYKLACLEEIAFSKNWIGPEDILNAARKYEKSAYGQYLLKLCK